MSSRLVAVGFDARDPLQAGEFWAAVLGREAVHESETVFVPGTPTQVGLRFIRSDAEKSGPSRLHLHLTNATLEGQQQAVQSVMSIGGRRRGTGPLPFGRDISMTDPSGEEFCEIAPGNAYLEGCGLLGEVTCQGTPTSGRFWLAALGWSLVWDQDDQIAIQSPDGGTKIAWDGQPEPAAPGWNRQRFELVTDDLDSEVRRLVDLGASRTPDRSGSVALLDPDGSEFTIASI